MINAHAVVVLPYGAHGRVVGSGQRRWLSRGRVSFEPPRSEMLESVLSVIGAPLPQSGLAALRFWGQTGERPGVWMAAADPVHLETRLRDLRVRSFLPDQVQPNEIQALFETLQSELGDDGQFEFLTAGGCGYLSGEYSMDTPAVSAAVAEGQVPDRYTPARECAVPYNRLLGELQMLFHEHDVNVQRQQSGLPAINSLWLWGSGVAPERAELPVPVLFSNDPLFRGYWESCKGMVEPWQGGFEDCLAIRPQGFVAVVPDTVPENAHEHLSDCLGMLENLFTRGEFRHLSLLFRDGLIVELRYADRFRFWRGVSPVFEEQEER